MNTIDKTGLCPNCKTDWNAGDILAELQKLDIFFLKNYKDMEKVAGNYGWKANSKSNLSKVKVYEYEDGTTLIECPNMKCGHVFNTNTGEEWDSMFAYKMGFKPKEKEPSLIEKMIPITREYGKTIAQIHNTIEKEKHKYPLTKEEAEEDIIHLEVENDCPFVEDQLKETKDEEKSQPATSPRPTPFDHFLKHIKK